MKIKNLKYIFGVVVGFLFFVGNVSFGLTEAANPSQCSSVNGYNSYGYSQYTTPKGNIKSQSNIDSDERFYNNQLALERTYEYHPNYTSIQGSISNIIAYKKLLLENVYPSSLGFGSYTEVWQLQNALKENGCSVRRDCKLGKDTSYAFFSCDICKKIDPSYEQAVSLNSSSDIVCRGGYEKVSQGAGSNLCCKEEEVGYEPVPPLITNTNSDWEGGVAHIVVQYQDYTADVDHWDQSMPAFGSSTGTLSNLNVNTSSLNVTFDVTNISDDVSSITVTVAPGLITFVGGSLSLGGSNTFNRTVPDSGSSGDCPAAPTNGSCGEGCAIVGSGCSPASTTCGSDEAAPGGGECKACEEGTMANEEHTKCICDSSKKCCGIQLNTVVPFIGDCIEMNTNSSRGDTTSVTSVTAFPILVQGLMKILMSAIMVFSFLMIIIAGLSMITGAFGGSGYNKGKTIIKNVIISLILLGCSGLILSLINPSFFGG